jgi:hypothetical protein
VVAAGGVLAVLATAAPVTAAPDPEPAPAAPAVATGSGPSAPGPIAEEVTTYRGRVIAVGGLYLRKAPNRGAPIVSTVPYGTVVHIYCKVTAENIDGNNIWYVLTDGTWAWGSARYIENIDAPPPWC